MKLKTPRFNPEFVRRIQTARRNTVVSGIDLAEAAIENEKYSRHKKVDCGGRLNSYSHKNIGRKFSG